MSDISKVLIAFYLSFSALFTFSFLHKRFSQIRRLKFRLRDSVLFILLSAGIGAAFGFGFRLLLLILAFLNL